jgi:hypothetical protein
MDKRYQVFVSSTFTDLIAERQASSFLCDLLARAWNQQSTACPAVGITSASAKRAVVCSR